MDLLRARRALNGPARQLRAPRAAGFDYHRVNPADVGILPSILSLREGDQAHLLKP